MLGFLRQPPYSKNSKRAFLYIIKTSHDCGTADQIFNPGGLLRGPWEYAWPAHMFDLQSRQTIGDAEGILDTRDAFKGYLLLVRRRKSCVLSFGKKPNFFSGVELDSSIKACPFYKSWLWWIGSQVCQCPIINQFKNPWLLVRYCSTTGCAHVLADIPCWLLPTPTEWEMQGFGQIGHCRPFPCLTLSLMSVLWWKLQSRPTIATSLNAAFNVGRWCVWVGFQQQQQQYADSWWYVVIWRQVPHMYINNHIKQLP